MLRVQQSILAFLFALNIVFFLAFLSFNNLYNDSDDEGKSESPKFLYQKPSLRHQTLSAQASGHAHLVSHGGFKERLGKHTDIKQHVQLLTSGAVFSKVPWETTFEVLILAGKYLCTWNLYASSGHSLRDLGLKNSLQLLLLLP